jgi:hypothetical protein
LVDRKIKVQATILTMPLMWLSAERLSDLFNLIGSGLQELRYKHHSIMFTHFRIPAAAAEYCKVLRRVDVTGDVFGSELSALFERCAETITELRVDVKHDGCFLQYLSLLQNLKVLYVASGGYINMQIPASVEELVLLHSWHPDMVHSCPASCRALILSDSRGGKPLNLDTAGLLSSCPQLDTFSAGGVEYPASLLSALQKSDRPWKALRLPSCPTPLGERAVISFLRRQGGSLRHLDLPAVVTARLLAAISGNCPDLEGLCLTGTCASEEVAELGNLFRSCRALRQICILHAPLDDALLQDLAAHCPLLECLGLPLGAQGLTAAGVQAALRQLPRLREVMLPRRTFPAFAAVLAVLTAWATAGPGRRVLTTIPAVPALPHWRRWLEEWR